MRAPRRLLSGAVVAVVVALALAAARGSWALQVGGGGAGRIGPPPAPPPPPPAPRRTAAAAQWTGGAAGASPDDRRALLLSPRSARLETGASASASSSSTASAASPAAHPQHQQHPQHPIFPTVKDDDPYVQTVFAAGSAPARRAEGAALVIPERASRERPADRLVVPASTATALSSPEDDDPDAGSGGGGEPLDLDLARALASLNTACYCRDLRAVARWRCGRCRAAAPDFRPSLVHFDAAWDLLGLIGYWPARKAIVVAFRGTDSGSLYNWAENMRAWRADARYPAPPRDAGGGGGGDDPGWPAPDGMRVHSGFLNLWNSSSMAATFSDAFAALLQANGGFVAAANGGGGGEGDSKNGAPSSKNGIEAAYVVGHSMGGALAHLCALDLATRFGPEVGKRTHVYTFGAPRVGNAPFSAWSRQRVASYWRFTHARDIVPSVPPQLMGFHHAAREVWLVARDAWPGWGDAGEDEQAGDGGSGGAGNRRRGGRRREVVAALLPSSSSSSSPPPLVRWPSWPIWPWPPGPPPPPPPGPPEPPTPPPPDPQPPLPPGAEERAVLCDPSGEDPSCHDSVCYLGLCTSVADHLLYLGRRFYHVDAECKAPTREEEEEGGWVGRGVAGRRVAGDWGGARVVVVGSSSS